ncbi:MAG: phosphatase PAP2 family protein [Patescibacteria group bacterium]
MIKANSRAFRTLILYIVFLAGVIMYLTTNQKVFFEPIDLPFTAIDTAIPFLSWTIVVYALIFPLIAIVPFLINTEVLFHRAMLCAIYVILLQMVFFVFFPTGYHARPDISGLEFPWQQIYSGLYKLDSSFNCYPSFHVSLCALIPLLLYHERPKLCLFFSVLCPLIAISTLTTKQHYFIDAVGGLGLGMVVYFVCLKAFPLKK